MSVLAYVEEDMWESEGLLCLEPTWEELADQLVVAVDALSASVPPTSSAQVTALALVQAIERFIEEANIQISSFFYRSRECHDAQCDSQRTREQDACSSLCSLHSDTHSHAHFFIVVVVVVLRHTHLTRCAHLSTFMVQGQIEKSFHQVIIC